MSSYLSFYQIIKKYNLSSNIIISDDQAWVNYPDFQFVYNKLNIAQSQNLKAAPMLVYPEYYPVVFKPIINLIGMSRGFKIIYNQTEYDESLKDGLFWEEYLTGHHFCVDLIIDRGNVLFFSALQSFASKNGSFLYHESKPNYLLPNNILNWIETFLQDYTGCCNMEIIDDYIIEAHLRLNGDFHLYNVEFAKKVSDFMDNKKVSFSDFIIPKIFLIPIFVDKHFSDKNIDKNYIISIFKQYDISHIFFDNVKSKYQSEFLSRFILFSCSSLDDGMNVKKKIINYLNNINGK